MMNILILSAGTRDKVVQFFKKELEGRGRVIATDCSNIATVSFGKRKGALYGNRCDARGIFLRSV